MTSALLTVVGLAAIGLGAWQTAVPIEVAAQKQEIFVNQENYSVKKQKWAREIALAAPCRDESEPQLPNPTMGQSTYRAQLKDLKLTNIRPDPHAPLDNLAVYATTENGFNQSWLRVQTW
jgi:hypothetical protein